MKETTKTTKTKEYSIKEFSKLLKLKDNEKLKNVSYEIHLTRGDTVDVVVEVADNE